MRIVKTDNGWSIEITKHTENDALIPILAELEQKYCEPHTEPRSASLLLSQRINFTPEENAAILAAGQAVQAEMEAQKHSLVVACSRDGGEMLLQVLSGRYREVQLKIRLAHSCPEDKFNLHGSPDGYWFELIPAPSDEPAPQYVHNNPALS